MTVRPNSELVIQQYKFSESAPDNSMVMLWDLPMNRLLHTFKGPGQGTTEPTGSCFAPSTQMAPTG